LVRYTEMKMPVSDPILYVTKVAARLQLKAQQATIKLLKKAIELRMTAGKDPMGLVAAATYIVAQKLGLTRYTQKQIAEAADVTEVTIRDRFKGLREALAPYNLLDTQADYLPFSFAPSECLSILLLLSVNRGEFVKAKPERLIGEKAFDSDEISRQKTLR
jgi:hypothetical protein